MATLNPMDLARFWSRVEGSTSFQCWPWRGQKNSKGYGRFRGKMAHRLAYELTNGSIPDGALVRHKCDNPVCCNPDHLLPGTHADNANDAIARGRTAIGEKNGKTRLTAEQALYIKRNPDRLSINVLAERFGVCKATVSYIRSGRSWKMVEGEGIEPPTAAMSTQCSTAELTLQSSTKVRCDLATSAEVIEEPSEAQESALRCQRRGLQ